MKIGDKIRARRKELGMTQQELADKMGYTNRSSIRNKAHICPNKRLSEEVG